MTEKIKLDFNEPHVIYRLKNGERVVGVTTALGMLNKPALPLWGFNTGKEPMFKSIDEAVIKTNCSLNGLTKSEAISWAFSVGQERKYQNLYGGMDKAANIGTIAHAILNARENGQEIDNSNIAEDNWNFACDCVKSHDKWFGAMTIKTIFAEKQLVSEKFKYGGMLDKYALIVDEETLIDYKSGKDIYDDYFIQLIAYSNLLLENGYPVKRAIIVNMPKTKGDNFKIDSKSIDSLFEAGYFEKFLAARDVYYSDQKIKQYKEVL